MKKVLQKRSVNFKTLLNPDGAFCPDIYPPPLHHSANPALIDAVDFMAARAAQHTVIIHEPDGSYWTLSNCQSCGGAFTTVVNSGQPGFPVTNRCSECGGGDTQILLKDNDSSE